MKRLGDNPTDEELRVMVAEVDEVDLFCDVYSVTSPSVFCLFLSCHCDWLMQTSLLIFLVLL